MMNLGLDISQIVYEGTGVARFTRGLVESILLYDRANHWTFFISGLRLRIDPRLKKAIQEKNHTLLEWLIPPKVLSLLWNDLHKATFYPSELKKLDLFITSDWTEPYLPGIKKATIVHDLVFKRYPETVEGTILKTQTARLEWVTKESEIIFADSLATEKDIRSYYPDCKPAIVVNYPGVNVNNPDKTDKPKRPFILTVGKLEPRKNLERLVKAFNGLETNDIDLIIAGPKGWQELGQDFKKENIKILEFVSDRELYSLYSSCLFFVYPSLWEGFGIPVIEAMKLGAPVACSNTSSVAEIAGDAAVTFDPEKIDGIAAAMKKLIADENLRSALTEKGFAQSAKFTWKNYYDRMMKSISSYYYDHRS